MDKNFALLYSKAYGIPLKGLLGQDGNSKLPKSTAIFNMGSAKNCPSMKLGLCAAAKFGVKCYAKKAEDLYPQVLPYRNRQEEFWKRISAQDFAIQFLMTNATKRNGFSALRFNESGDFHNQGDVEKANEIARILKSNGIVTYCYTSRKDLNFKKAKHIVISGSGFQKEGIKNVFQIVKSKKDKLPGYGLCKCDCRVCNRCQKRGIKTCIPAH